MKQAHGFGMYGQWGQITDPGEKEFTEKVKALGVNVHDSPYRDYEVPRIVGKIAALMTDIILFVWGSSLGANNAPVVIAYLPNRIIHGLFGFQASLYGAQVPIRSNCLFAHEFYNPTWIETMGLGAYEWTRAPNNHVTKLIINSTSDFHPGETITAQNAFLADMKRIMEEAK